MATIQGDHSDSSEISNMNLSSLIGLSKQNELIYPY